MRTTIMMVVPLLAALAVTGCGDGNNDNSNAGRTPVATPTATPTPTGNPAPPAVGAQIDRMGRAGVNTALIGVFDADADARGAEKDAYNAASDPAQWGSLFAEEIAGNLAIYDALDGVCGTQLLAGDTAEAGRYDGLAGVLADDRLFVNTDSGSCGVYLAVEADATGVIPNDDCGGRTPLEDTIDVTYSVLALGDVSGVVDGIADDSDGAQSATVFPYYAPPL